MPKTDSQWLMDEEWKPIPGYEGWYSVSNWGRVKSHDRIVKTHHERHQATRKGRVLRPLRITGQLYVDLRKDGLHQRHHIGKLVAQAFIANPQNLRKVRHLDGDRSNNKVANLEWCAGFHNRFFNYRYK